jgi:hypothetical protein
VPDIVGQVATEEASYLFGTGVLAVEETTRGKVVSLAILHELLIGGQDLIRVVLQIAERGSADTPPSATSPDVAVNVWAHAAFLAHLGTR